MPGVNFRSLTEWFLMALPSAVLIVSFLVICAHTGTVWPWLEIVHESGERTLIGTIFYFEHAARELPLDVVLGIAIGGCILMIRPPSEGWTMAGRPRRRRMLGPAIVVTLATAAIVVGAWVQVGWQGLIDNLLQYHSRPGFPPEWGIHWRYHLLSRLALVFLCAGLAGLIRLLTYRFDAEVLHIAATPTTGLKVVLGSIALFLVTTGLFSASFSEMLRSVNDPIFVGHQARELFTHALVTIPIGWGVCMLVTRKAASSSLVSRFPRPGQVPLLEKTTLGLGLVGILIGALMFTAALISDAAAHGQTDNLGMLLFPHFFEHGFTYLIVPSTATLVYAMFCPDPVRSAAFREGSQ